MSNTSNNIKYSMTDKLLFGFLCFIGGGCAIGIIYLAARDKGPALAAQAKNEGKLVELNEMLLNTDVVKGLHKRLTSLEGLVSTPSN